MAAFVVVGPNIVAKLVCFTYIRKLSAPYKLALSPASVALKIANTFVSDSKS